MSEVIVSVLDFIIKSNVQNPVEMVLMFTIIGCALYYFVKIKPDKDKKSFDAAKRRDALEERRLSDERSKTIDSENKRYHDTMSKKTDFDKIETKIENIQHDIAVIKALINNNR